MIKCKLFLLICLNSILFSCEENKKDNQFCECLAVSKSLNDKNAELLEKTNKSDNLIAELKQLVSEKRRICKPYEQMSGEEMIEREKSCE